MFEKIEESTLVYYRSDNITARHLFSTRLGGVSTKPHLASMNVGENRGDSEENVIQNITILTRQIGCTPDEVIRSRQIHSANVRAVHKNDAGAFFDDCDGFVTNERGICLTVKVADCVPILLCDNEASVIGALHAGWRGSASGILGEGIKKMILLGATVSNIKIAIGASIRLCCYEVGKDFDTSVSESIGFSAQEKGIITKTPEGKYFADLVKLNTHFASISGIPPENISVCQECTCCHPELFFSHRYSKGHRGTMCAMITL